MTTFSKNPTRRSHHRQMFLFAVLGLVFLALKTEAAVWQWSVPMGGGRAFLWIPSDCRQVRAVLVGQHNMLEQGILEDPVMRGELAKLGIGEVWIAPPFDGVFHFDQGAGDRFNAMMKGLADVSGYGELDFAPIIPLGHSACASYPWNFAAWNPARTLAILSVHGDAPQTNRTGSGHPNPDWGDRNIDGIPALMVMGEYEWSEDRLTPALDFRRLHPQAPIAFLAEPGSGHYDTSARLISFLTMFIRKAAEARLPVDEPLDQPLVLKAVNPAQGWLVERGHLNEKRTVQPAPAAKYTGDPTQAFWCFDEEMARATQDYSANQIGKLPQLISLTDGHMPVAKGCGEPVNLGFFPGPDGITFQLQTHFMDVVAGEGRNAARWAYLPAGSPLGHATGSPIVISKIVGPAEKVSGDTFAVQLDRNAETRDGRLNDVWLFASQPGDDRYKSIYQPAILHLKPNLTGTDQHLTFPAIPDQKPTSPPLTLPAVSDAGLPVHYYVREGPATIENGVLTLTPIPPRTKFPVEVTVTAWQWGRSASPAVKTAEPVSCTFSITP